MHPLISVIIPVYNTEKYIGRCLESILQQSYQEIEIIVVDDGSTDGSLTICHDYQLKHPNHLRIFSKPNGGVSSARNFGINQTSSSSKYIAFIDSDDIVSPKYLETLAGLITTNELPICSIQRFVDVNHIKEDTSVETIKTISDLSHNPEFFKLLYSGVLHSPCLKLFNTEIVRTNKLRFKELTLCEDFEFNLCYLDYCQTIIHTSKRLYYYNRTPGSLTTKSSTDMFDNYMMIHQRLLDKYDKCFESEIDTLIYRQYESIAMRFARHHKFRSLKKYLSQPLINKACKAFQPTSLFERLVNGALVSKSPLLLLFILKLSDLYASKTN